MRVTFLTHYYPPEVGAPQARLSALARLLVEHGAEVAVHTGFPHYPSGRIEPPYRNRAWLVEGDAGVRVVRSAVYPAFNSGFARRLLNHASLAGSALATSRLTGGADVVVVESPPLFTAAAGVAYARLKRAPLIINVADRWPASAVELGLLTNPTLVGAATWLEGFCYRNAAALTTPTAGLVETLAALPEAPSRVVRIWPSVDLDRFKPRPPARQAGPLQAVYAGTIGLAQGIGTLMEAARIAGPETVSVTISGDGAEAPELREACAAKGIANVRFTGALRHEAVPGLLADADVVAVLLRDRPIFEAALPTKLLEAMAAGRPVVLSARGEAARLVEDAGAGVVVPPEDPHALAAAFRTLQADRKELESFGAAGRAHVERRFGRARLIEDWSTLLESVAADGRR